MDPSIMKLLEEDEDESMHSGADVEAFTAALNRDIEGGTSTCEPSQSETSAFSQESNHTSSQMYSQWQPSMPNNTNVNHSHQQELRLQEKQEDQASQLEKNEHVSDVGIKQEVHKAPQHHQPQNMPIQVDVKGHQVEHNTGQNSQSSASAQMQILGTARAHIPVTDGNPNPTTGSQLENVLRFSGNQPAPMTEQVGASTPRHNQIPSGSSPKVGIKQDVYNSQAPQHHQPQNMPILVDVKGHQVEHNSGQNSWSSASVQMQISGTTHSQIPVTDRNPTPTTGSQFEHVQRFNGNQPAPMTEQADASAPRPKQIPFGSSSDVGNKQKVQDSQAPQHHHPQNLPIQVDVKGHQVEHNSGQNSQSSASAQMHISGTAHAQIPVTYRNPDPSTGSQVQNVQSFSGNQPAPMTEQAGASAPRPKQIPFGSLPGLRIKQEVQDSQAPQHHQPQNMPMQVDVKGHQVERNSLQSSQSSAAGQMQKFGTGDPQIPVTDRKPDPTTGSQFTSFQKCSGNQPITMGEQAGSLAPRQNQIPFGSLLPIIIPELDKDKAMQLQTLYNKLRRNEIPKESFVRLMRGIVGDQMLRVAVLKMQAKAQNPTQQKHSRPPVPPIGAAGQYVDPNSFGQLHQKNQGTHPVPVTGPSRAPASANQPNTSGHQNIDSSTHKPRELDRMTDSQRMHSNQMSCRSAVSIQGLTKEQQQHLHFSQSSFPMYGVNNHSSHSSSNVSSPSTMVRPQPPVQLHQGSGPAHGDGTNQAVNVENVPKVERQNSLNDSKSVPAPSMRNMSTASMQHNAISWQPMPSKEQTFLSSTRIANIGDSSSFAFPMDAGTQMANQSSSASPMSGAGGNSKTSAKQPIIGQKKPLDCQVSSPPLPSKKQKVSGAFADQSIEHLNDVTAVSGVNLREEEEQLFSLPKDDSRVSEASRRAVQEEEERLILQKIPLQKKLAEIMTKCGLQNLSNDVQRCLSLCVEERLRALVSSLITVSKQRADSEKSSQSTVVNSDVREHIMVVNRKAREEWDKKQAEADKLRKQNEPDSGDVADVEMEKDEGRPKSSKANKDEDDKMRTTAANVAARAAVGGDDMLSKWQLMAQARQKRGPETAIGSQVGKDVNPKGSATSTGIMRDRRVVGNKDYSSSALRSGAVRQSGRSQVTSSPPRVARSVSVKDIIAVLEREPQMAKSTMIYRLYNRLHADSATWSSTSRY